MFNKALFVAATLLSFTYAAHPVSRYCGTSTVFAAQADQLDQDVVTELYSGCSERVGASGVITKGNVCMAKLVSYMLQSIATVADGSQSVAVVNSTINSTTTLNTRRHTLSKLSGPRDDGRSAYIHVTNTVPSQIHPRDGRAYRMNVRSDNATLYVHTNGSHAIARFENDQESMRAKRNEILAADDHFSFSGPEGVKVEAHGIHNGGLRNYKEDLIAYAYGFAYGTGSGSTFQGGNSWKYTLCDASVSNTLFYGRIIAELTDFSSNYEQVGPPECTQCA